MLHELVLKRKYQEVAKHLHSSAMGTVVHPELNAQDPEGNTPIHLAATLNDTKMIEILLGAGAKLHIKNNQGILAKEISSEQAIGKKLSNAELLVAAWNNDIKIAQELVQNGSNPNDEVSVMVLSAMQGEIIGLHPTPVSAAAYKKNEAIVKFFKSNNANIEFAEAASSYKNRDYGLFEAIDDDNIPAIKGLVGCFGHKVNCTVYGGGYNGMKYHDSPTPLSYAINHGNIEVIKLLVALGATLNDQYAMSFAKRCRITEVRRLFNLPPEEEPKLTNAAQAESKVSSERQLIIYDEGIPQFKKQVLTFLFKQFLSQTTSVFDKNSKSSRKNDHSKSKL